MNTDRLSTTNEQGKRIYVYPADVHGSFRKLRNYTQAFLVLFFLLLPWLKWDGKQLFLLNIAERRFHFFGITLWSHHAPILLFLFLTITLLIGFITAIWGRVWCGWACPQTVFIDGVFRRIEKWIEGAHRDRKELDDGPWNSEKIYKKTLKYFLFLLVSLVITHSFLAYFVGANKVLEMMSAAPSDNWASFLVIFVSTGIILFDFAWFREQFCIIMCPYGRFQSVLMDDNSLIIGYDAARGEPRRDAKQNMSSHGDCISCNRCVQVCPTGIDIRNGLQMECIACTACIDACDTVMKKIQKPEGLIRYSSANELAGKKRIKIRPRTFIYLFLLLSAGTSLGVALSKIDNLHITILRAKDTPYQVLNGSGTTEGSTKWVINHFKVDIANELETESSLQFSLPLEMQNKKHELVMAENPVLLRPSSSKKVDFFIRFPITELVSGHGKSVIQSQASGQAVAPKKEELNLVGPFF